MRRNIFADKMNKARGEKRIETNLKKYIIQHCCILCLTCIQWSSCEIWHEANNTTTKSKVISILFVKQKHFNTSNSVHGYKLRVVVVIFLIFQDLVISEQKCTHTYTLFREKNTFFYFECRKSLKILEKYCQASSC